MKDECTKAAAIEFARRARRRTTLVARERTWLSTCGRYKVVEARSLFRGMPTVYYAEVRCDDGGPCKWDLISRHRTRRAAEIACGRHRSQVTRSQGR